MAYTETGYWTPHSVKLSHTEGLLYQHYLSQVCVWCVCFNLPGTDGQALFLESSINGQATMPPGGCCENKTMPFYFLLLYFRTPL